MSVTPLGDVPLTPNSVCHAIQLAAQHICAGVHPWYRQQPGSAVPARRVHCVRMCCAAIIREALICRGCETPVTWRHALSRKWAALPGRHTVLTSVRLPQAAGIGPNSLTKDLAAQLPEQVRCKRPPCDRGTICHSCYRSAKRGKKQCTLWVTCWEHAAPMPLMCFSCVSPAYHTSSPCAVLAVVQAPRRMQV